MEREIRLTLRKDACCMAGRLVHQAAQDMAPTVGGAYLLGLQTTRFPFRGG